MDLKGGILGLCYDTQLKLKDAYDLKDTEEVLLWFHDKMLLLIKHWEQNKRDRNLKEEVITPSQLLNEESFVDNYFK